jgi:starch-binding outer membrane protein, SusD/RagB family
MRKLYLLVYFSGLLCLGACEKYLNKKPDQKLAVPTSLQDFQKLMEQNRLLENALPALGDLGCDDYFYSSAILTPASVPTGILGTCYKWEPDIFEGNNSNDWATPYGNIYICNVVIEGLENFETHTPEEETVKANLTGTALFIRALHHYYLEETFGQPFRPQTADTALGIPIKTSANLAKIAVRRTVKEVFDQIITDLLMAKGMLPRSTVLRNKGSKAAVFALLSKVYLTMQDYVKAKEYADSTLAINNVLANYSQYQSSFPAGPNEISEVLYSASQLGYTFSSFSIDTVLYNSYHPNDLRRAVFFRSSPPGARYYQLKPGYSGSLQRLICMPSVDEIYLIRAECNARMDNKIAALADLNALMSKRWSGSAPVINTSTSEEALERILIERRKELVFRGNRWIDLRRLNQELKFADTLTRRIGNQIIQLLPNSPRYTYPIPDNEIKLSGLQQNPR